MATAQDDFVPISIEQRLPNNLDMRNDISAPSQIKSREIMREPPRKAGTYKPGSVVEWRITSDGDKLADFSNSSFRVPLKKTGDTDNEHVFDEWVISIFNRGEVLVDGTHVEDIPNLNVTVAALFILYANENYCNHLSMLTGEYKYSQSATNPVYRMNEVADNTAATLNNRLRAIQSVQSLKDRGARGVVERARVRAGKPRTGLDIVSYEDYPDAVFKDNADDEVFIIPLSLLFGVARQLKSFPVGKFGNWQIRLTLESSTNVMWNYFGYLDHNKFNSGVNVSYEVKDPELLVEYLTVSEQYSQALDTMISAPSEGEGVVYDIDTYTVLSDSKELTQNPSSNTYNFALNNKFLKSITTWAKYDEQMDNLDYNSITGFPAIEWEEMQLKVGSHLRPNQPIKGALEAYMHNAVETGSMGHLDWHNLQLDRRNFTEARDLVAYLADGTARDEYPAPTSVSFGTQVKHFNLRRSIADPHSMDAVDISSTSGGKFSLRFRGEKAGRQYNNDKNNNQEIERTTVTRYAAAEIGKFIKLYNQRAEVEE